MIDLEGGSYIKVLNYNIKMFLKLTTTEHK